MKNKLYYLVFVSGLVITKICKIKNFGGTKKTHTIVDITEATRKQTCRFLKEEKKKQKKKKKKNVSF